MPDNFAESPDGLLYVANGQDSLAYWDGKHTAFRKSGVVAPATAPSMSPSGTGDVVGRFYAYLRYVDDRGNFSNLSPRSTLYEPTSSPITITDVAETSPIRITTSIPHSLISGQQILVSNVKGCTSANGVYIVTRISDTTFDLDNSAPNGTYTGEGDFTTGVDQITYSGLETPTDPKIARRQILRNKDGNAEVFYIDIDTSNLSATSLSSDKTSLDLSDPVALFDDTGVDNAVAIYTPAPDFKAVIANYKGRMFAMVDEDATEGCVSVTNGSTAVTGIGTQFLAGHSGRYLDVPGAPQKVAILSVQSTTALTLAGPYGGSTDPYANYTIRTDDNESRSMYWSGPNLPEAWPDDATRTLQEDPGSGRMTGLLPMGGWLFPTAENRIYRFNFSSDPATDSSVPVAVQRGLANNRLAATIDGAAFLLDSLGIHVFTGGDTDPRIGDAVNDAFKNNPTGDVRINWSRKRYFHCVTDPSDAVIRWFVCLDGNRYPHDALCLDYRSGRWWIENYPFPVASSCMGYINGRSQVFLGSRLGRVLAIDRGLLDGLDPAGGTTRGTATSGGPSSISDTSATFPTTNIVGFPISLVDGRGKGQQRVIWKVVGTTIYTRTPWRIQPDSTTVYQLGGIQFRYKTPWFEFTESSDEIVRAFGVQLTPTATTASLDVQLYKDFSETAENQSNTQRQAEYNGIGTDAGLPDFELQTTKPNPYFYHRFDGFKAWGSDGPRHLSLGITGTAAADRLILRTIRIDGVAGG